MITFWWALGATDGMGVLSTLERISGAEKSRTLWVNAHACLKTLYPKMDEHGPGLIIFNYHICSKFFPYQNGPFRVNSISGQTR